MLIPETDRKDRFRFEQNETPLLRRSEMKQMKITKLSSSLTALAATGLIVLSAYDLQAEGEGRKGGACKADIERLCGKVDKGDGRIRKCIMENKDKLSPACKARLEKRKELRKENRSQFREACKADHQKLCKGKKGKEGMRCLMENKAQLSSSCKTVMEELIAKRKNKK